MQYHDSYWCQTCFCVNDTDIKENCSFFEDIKNTIFDTQWPLSSLHFYFGFIQCLLGPWIATSYKHVIYLSFCLPACLSVQCKRLSVCVTANSFSQNLSIIFFKFFCRWLEIYILQKLMKCIFIGKICFWSCLGKKRPKIEFFSFRFQKFCD